MFSAGWRLPPTNPMLATENGSSFTNIPDMAKDSTVAKDLTVAKDATVAKAAGLKGTDNIFDGVVVAVGGIDNIHLIDVPAIQGQIAAVKDDVWDEPLAGHAVIGTAGQRVEANYQGTFGEWQMIGNQLIFRNESGVEIARLDLFDQTGHPTMANIFWRVPV